MGSLDDELKAAIFAEITALSPRYEEKREGDVDKHDLVEMYAAQGKRVSPQAARKILREWGKKPGYTTVLVRGRNSGPVMVLRKVDNAAA